MTERDDEIEQFPVKKRQIRYEAEPEMIFFDVDEDPAEADFIRVDDLFQLDSRAAAPDDAPAELPSQEFLPAQPKSPAAAPDDAPAELPAQEFSPAQPELPAAAPDDAPAELPAQEFLPAQPESPAAAPDDAPAELPAQENGLFRRKILAEDPAGGAHWFTLFPQKKDSFIDSRLSRVLRRTLMLTACRLEKPVDKIRIRPQFIQWFMELSPNDNAETAIQEFRDALELQAQNLLTVNLKGLFLSDTCIVQPTGKEPNVEETIRAVTRYQEGQDMKGTQK